jgi:hypothetical protein
VRIAIRATEEAIIRLLKAGHPLPGDVVNRPEETRLPVFQSVEAVPVKDFGMEGAGRIVLARGRKDVWFVDIKRRDSKVTSKEGEAFVEMRDKLQKLDKFKSQKVTGWLVTTADMEKKTTEFITEQGCFATAGAAKR